MQPILIYLPFAALLFSAIALAVSAKAMMIQRGNLKIQAQNRQDKHTADVSQMIKDLAKFNASLRSRLNSMRSNTEVIRIEAARLKDTPLRAELQAEVKVILDQLSQTPQMLGSADAHLIELSKCQPFDERAFTALHEFNVTAQFITSMIEQSEEMSLQALTLIRKNIEAESLME